MRTSNIAGTGVLVALALLTALLVITSWPAPAADAAPTEGSSTDGPPASGEPSDDTVADAPQELPISVTFAPDGRAYVGDKRGLIATAASIEELVTTGPTEIVADLRDVVYDFGDHGLTSVEYHDGFVYTTFMTRSEPCGSGDYDEEWNTTCPSYGAVARFPVAEDGRLGPREHVVGGEQEPIFCARASSHGLNNVFVGPDDALYLAAGDGAGFGDADIGQYDGDPCGGDGAFRSQDPDHAMGKIHRLDPETGELTTYASGLRNPFRQTVHEGVIYSTDTGWFTTEEINRVEEGSNHGWPCWEGLEPAPEYAEAFGSRCDDIPNDEPAYHYDHSGSSAITSIASFDGRLYIGDHAEQWIRSLEPGDERPTDVREADVWPVDLVVAPDGALYVANIWPGQIEPVMGAQSATSTAPLTPTATIELDALDEWRPGQLLTATLVTNLFDPMQVRAPVETSWQVVVIERGEAREVPFTLRDDGRRIELTTPEVDAPAELRITADAVVPTMDLEVATSASLVRASTPLDRLFGGLGGSTTVLILAAGFVVVVALAAFGRRLRRGAGGPPPTATRDDRHSSERRHATRS